MNPTTEELRTATAMTAFRHYRPGERSEHWLKVFCTELAWQPCIFNEALAWISDPAMDLSPTVLAAIGRAVAYADSLTRDASRMFTSAPINAQEAHR